MRQVNTERNQTVNITATTVSPEQIAAAAARMKVTTLNTGAWRATRQHKAETKAENERHNTDAAKVLVRVSDHQALGDLVKLHAKAWQAHKRFTMPTVQEGMRVVPLGREFEHAEVMRKFGDEHSKLVQQFMADYDQEKAEAPTRLNGLYDESMWPSHAEVERKFTFRTRYLPTPTGGEWSEWLAESIQVAQLDLHDRITEVLTRVRDRCKNTDGKLYTSVFEAVRDLTELVPDFDMTGVYAPVVEAIKPLTAIEADDIRDDEKARKRTARKANEILGMLGGIK